MVKDYGQFCGLAKASSVLGERWALLIVRDLSVAPCRFKDLHDGLPKIPTSVLTARLRDLRAAGVVTRVADGQPGGGVFYRLTTHGRALEPILDALGTWGAGTMDVPEPHDVITDASLAAALRAGFRAGAVDAATRYVVRADPAVAWADAAADSVTVGAGAPEFVADVTIHAGPGLRALLAAELTPAAALSSGAVRIEGPPEMLERFTRTFHVPLAKAPEAP